VHRKLYSTEGNTDDTESTDLRGFIPAMSLYSFLVPISTLCMVLFLAEAQRRRGEGAEDNIEEKKSAQISITSKKHNKS
jgi:hypothetical protein